MRHSLFLFCLCLLAACSSTRRSARYCQRHLSREIRQSPVFSKSITGFHLIDAATGAERCAILADHYFTSASNTKILTLATCLNLLGDSLPGLQYQYKPSNIVADSMVLVFRGTGDPTFLHPDFQAWQPAFALLRNHHQLAWMMEDLPPERFGPGWCWDDYSDAYSAERSPMPLYGNVIRLVKNAEGWTTHPADFQFLLKETDGTSIRRLEFSNEILVPREVANFPPGFTKNIPQWRASDHFRDLLVDTLHRPITLVGNNNRAYRNLYSCPVDTVYRRMMHQSDNFVAEQLLLVCARAKFGTLRQENIIDWAKDSLFAAYPEPPRWVDGSGLSRYNLISPRFLTALLRQLYQEQPAGRLLDLFPAGGVSGTIENWFRSPDGQPFVFAKTGSMSGVYCLSGYLRCKSGKWMIFSFMHNNFVGSGRPVKEEMRRILETIHRH